MMGSKDRSHRSALFEAAKSRREGAFEAAVSATLNILGEEQV